MSHFEMKMSIYVNLISLLVLAGMYIFSGNLVEQLHKIMYFCYEREIRLRK